MKTAIVTGTNRGIGLGIIEELARNHINVWACARKQTTDFEEKLYDLSKQTGQQSDQYILISETPRQSRMQL